MYGWVCNIQGTALSTKIVPTFVSYLGAPELRTIDARRELVPNAIYPHLGLCQSISSSLNIGKGLKEGKKGFNPGTPLNPKIIKLDRKCCSEINSRSTKNKKCVKNKLERKAIFLNARSAFVCAIAATLRNKAV